MSWDTDNMLSGHKVTTSNGTLLSRDIYSSEVENWRCLCKGQKAVIVYTV